MRELSTGFIPDRDYRNLAIASESRINTPIGASDVLLGISDRPYGAAGFYNVPLGIPSWERDKGWLAAWTQPIGSQTTADFGYRRHTDEYVYVKTEPSLYENNHVATYYQAALRRFDKIGENMRIYYGMDGIREHLDSNNLGIRTRDQGGAYASFDARALKRFSFTVGAREELYTGGQQVFSPSVSGAYWVSSRVKLRASVSHGFRLPDFTELYYSDPGTLGNPNLKAETSWSYEGGVQAALGYGIILDADVFHHHDDNVIDYAGAPGAIQVAQNIHDLELHRRGSFAALPAAPPATLRAELYGDPWRRSTAARPGLPLRLQLSGQRRRGDVVEQNPGRLRFALPRDGRAAVPGRKHSDPGCLSAGGVDRGTPVPIPEAIRAADQPHRHQVPRVAYGQRGRNSARGTADAGTWIHRRSGSAMEGKVTSYS